MKAIFITVRTGSSRLPKKALLEINGLPTITRVIRRVAQSQKKDIVVLCTTVEEEDTILAQIAQQEGINFFRGSTLDKLDRWNKAAKQYNVEFFVTADGDDLFCEPELIDLAFSQYEKNKPDFIEGVGLACGSFSYAIKASALAKVCEIKDTDQTEMMWTYFKDTGQFNCETLQGVNPIFQRPDIRITLDYPDDFTFFKTVIEHFEKNGNDSYYSLRDIINYLNSHPEVVKVNQHCQNLFLTNQKKKTFLKLKKT